MRGHYKDKLNKRAAMERRLARDARIAEQLAALDAASDKAFRRAEKAARKAGVSDYFTMGEETREPLSEEMRSLAEARQHAADVFNVLFCTDESNY